MKASILLTVEGNDGKDTPKKEDIEKIIKVAYEITMNSEGFALKELKDNFIHVISNASYYGIELDREYYVEETNSIITHHYDLDDIILSKSLNKCVNYS